jgi:hypothetical protein
MNMKVAALALVGAMGFTSAHAAKPGSTTVYIPPTNMVVECGNFAKVTANVPARTKIVYYTFYNTDPAMNAKNYPDMGVTVDAYIGAESGPSGPAPNFYYAAVAGGVPIPTASGMVFVWAEAVARTGSKPLAWGFATCFSNPPISILLNSGSTTLLRLTDGSIQTVP